VESVGHAAEGTLDLPVWVKYKIGHVRADAIARRAWEETS
jgi:hypothetical protein